MSYPASELVIDPVLIRKYDVNGPCYTLYPTADRFVEAFGEADCRHWLATRNIGGIHQPLAVYVHLASGETAGSRRALSKLATRDHGRSTKYIKRLMREFALAGRVLGDERRIGQVYWGGATALSRAPDAIGSLAGALMAEFQREPDCECWVDVDAHTLGSGDMSLLASLGFNCVSLEVRDFDRAVQRAVHRLQSEEATHRAIDEARVNGFRAVNVDLIHGLPKQTLDSFNTTLDKVLALVPDRIALRRYADSSDSLKPARFAETDLASLETNLQILTLAIGRLTRAGYLYIGMDHFAKPSDDLTVAQRQGRLQRNLQGYSTRPESDVLAFGISAIGRIGPTYYQNRRDLGDYCDAVDAGRLPVLRGLELSADDLVRRAVIQALACHFRISIESIEIAHLIDFKRYFSEELVDLAALADEGLVELTPDWIVVSPKGRLLVRAVCMVFDKHLRASRRRASSARVI
jgi:oxygen-independent coproporphyrinogen-3 oxidase